jgi:hypothetical protein
MDRPPTPDIVAFLHAAEKWIGDELELSQLQVGDRLLVRTRNTQYHFAMTGRHTALLSTNRADRPSGPVQIQGCTFGRSSMIKPDHLFCGGTLEILCDQGKKTFTTTAIETIQLVKISRPANGTP